MFDLHHLQKVQEPSKPSSSTAGRPGRRGRPAAGPVIIKPSSFIKKRERPPAVGPMSATSTLSTFKTLIRMATDRAALYLALPAPFLTHFADRLAREVSRRADPQSAGLAGAAGRWAAPWALGEDPFLCEEAEFFGAGNYKRSADEEEDSEFKNSSAAAASGDPSSLLKKKSPSAGKKSARRSAHALDAVHQNVLTGRMI